MNCRHLLLIALCAAHFLQSDETFRPSVEVYFSPSGCGTQACVTFIGAARRSILVQAYRFTSAPIAAALVAAHKRGVKVEAVLDKSQRTEKYSSADFIAHSGIPTFIDAKHAIVHNKIMIVDEVVVITGSFNFTKAAEERNAENLLVIRDAALAARYIENWRTHRAHSEAYAGRSKGPALTPANAQGLWDSCSNFAPFGPSRRVARSLPPSLPRALRFESL